MPYAADWNTVLNFDHIRPISDNLQLNTTLSLAYIDDYRTGTENDPRFMQDGFETIDLRFSLGNTDETWSVSLWGRNLTDELVVGQSTNAAVRSLGPILQTTSRPMSWGLAASYKF